MSASKRYIPEEVDWDAQSDYAQRTRREYEYDLKKETLEAFVKWVTVHHGGLSIPQQTIEEYLEQDS